VPSLSLACDSSCATCSNTPQFCLTCSSSSVALNGTCVNSCPTGFFTNNGTCSACHPDCATCSGSATNCASCPPSRPVLTTSGSTSTCLLSCAENEYFDSQATECKPCSSSCATCSGPSSTECLSCGSQQVVQSGACSTTSCPGGVVPGFGVCLQTLVTVDPSTSEASTSTSKGGLPAWVIVLIVLGVLALLGLCLYLWRRKNKKKRGAKTEQFKQKRGLGGMLAWIWQHRKRQKKGAVVDTTAPPSRKQDPVMVGSSSSLPTRPQETLQTTYVRDGPVTVVSNPYFVDTRRGASTYGMRGDLRENARASSSASSASSSYSARDSYSPPNAASLQQRREAEEHLSSRPSSYSRTSISPSPRRGDRRVVLIEYSRPAVEQDDHAEGRGQQSPTESLASTLYVDPYTSQQPPPYSGGGGPGFPLEKKSPEKSSGTTATYPPEAYYANKNNTFDWLGRAM
jgi:hypothetical protein